MTRWRALINQTSFEQDLYDVDLRVTANPFGDFAVLYIDDSQGSKFDTYTRGTRVDVFYVDDENPGLRVSNGETHTVDAGDTETYSVVEVDSGGTLVINGTLSTAVLDDDGTVTVNGTLNVTGSQVNRLSGYVVEARELDRDGADSLEVEVYSFDQFLRRNTVSNDQTGNTISEALEDIITSDTPVTYTAGNVTVSDDQTLTEPYQGERVENVLQNLAFKSGNEDFGVNSDIEFYWRSRETNTVTRGISNNQWTDYDIPEVGKETVNEVTVFFDSGSKSVVVDDGADKLALQSDIGTPDPVTIGEEVHRPALTDLDDARVIAEKILQDTSSTLTGTVETFGLLGVSPGDVVSVAITERGVDTDFRVAQAEYNWGTDSTVFTVVEARGAQDDLLVRLSDSTKRVELRDVDRTATRNVVTSTSMGGVITASGDVDGTSFSAAKITNTLRNLIRDGWGGDGNVDVATLRVGNDSSQPTRTDTGLGNELESVAVSESLPDSSSVLYEASFTETDIREIGLFDSNGDLLARGIVPETTFTGSPAVDFDLSVSNDSTLTNGVLTDAGITTTRDIVADNTPALPTDYAYGSDSTDPATTDTALGSQETSVTLSDVLVQFADSDSEWTDVTPSFSDTSPQHVTGGELLNYQSGFYAEAENADTDIGTRGTTGSEDDNYSNATGRVLEVTGDTLVWQFTNEYTIPAASVGIKVRVGLDSGTQSANAFTWTLDDQTVDYLGSTGVTLGSLGWDDIGSGIYDGAGYQGGDLEPGVHTLQVVVDDGGAAGDLYFVDGVHVYDTRYSYTFDNTTDGNNALSGPELYPELTETEFVNVPTRRNLDEATVTQTWDDTTNNQYIALSNDDGATYSQTNNSASATETFASSSTEIRVKVGVGRYGTGTSTPTNGNNSQAIDDHEIRANLDTIIPIDIGTDTVEAVVSPGTITGTTVREAGELDTSANLLTHGVFADIAVAANERLISGEQIGWRNP